MSFPHRLAFWLLTTLLFSSLMFFVYSWTFNRTVANREVVKTWLEDSGTYENLVDEVVASSSEQSSDGFTVDSQIINEAAQFALTPEVVRQNFDSVIDGAYDWLEGSTDEVIFEINLVKEKDKYFNELVNAAEKRAAKLPVCNTYSNFDQNFDPFSAKCKPVGLDFSTIRSEYKRSLANSNDFISDPIISASDIKMKSDEADKSISEAAPYLPGLYKFAHYGTYLSFIVFALSAFGILYFAKTKRKSVFLIFRAFAFTAISLAIFTYFSAKSSSFIDQALTVDESTQGFTESIIKPLINVISDSFAYHTFRFMIFYGVLGVIVGIIWFYLYKTKDKSTSNLNPKK